MFFMRQGARRCDYEAHSSRMSLKQANEVKQGQKRSKERVAKEGQIRVPVLGRGEQVGCLVGGIKVAVLGRRGTDNIESQFWGEEKTSESWVEKQIRVPVLGSGGASGSFFGRWAD